MIQWKDRKIIPGRSKKFEKVKIFEKLFIQLPIWKQIVEIWQQFCQFCTANPTFSPPKSEFVSQSQNNVLPKCRSGHIKCNFDDCWKVFAGSSRKCASKSKRNWKKMFLKNELLKKISGRLECTFNKNDETFFQN